MITVKLHDVKFIANKFNLSMQKALGILHKTEDTNCPNCKKKGMLEYHNCLVYSCIFAIIR